MNRILDKIYKIWAFPISRVILALFVVWTFGGIGIWILESDWNNGENYNPKSFDHLANSLWWTIVTMTTVGFGDMAPEGVPGRIFAIIIMIVMEIVWALHI